MTSIGIEKSGIDEKVLGIVSKSIFMVSPKTSQQTLCTKKSNH